MTFDIAFYAPLKAPDHPVPSGDRQMARQLMAALSKAGHRVALASRLRGYLGEPSAQALASLRAGAEAEVRRIADMWRRDGRPDLWLCYHPYYKAPDLIGPPLARAFAIPYATAEASYSTRRGIGAWAETQADTVDAVRRAGLNVCFTRRDLAGLQAAAPDARYEMLPPFIDTGPFGTPASGEGLMSVAMMRKGDKLASFAMLAAALLRLLDLPWTLTVIGDGPARQEVAALFGAVPGGRIEWVGELDPPAVPDVLRRAGLYVWPGCGEAYGLAYLEAQAAGLPVIAQAAAGVSEVVRHGETGILTPAGDVAAYAGAIRRLLADGSERQRMAEAARRFVLGERSLDQAAARLADILAAAVPEMANTSGHRH